MSVSARKGLWIGLLAALLVPAASRPQASKNDFILYGGDVVTLDDAGTVAEAVWVRAGRIEAVGKREEILRLAPKTAERMKGGQWEMTSLVRGHSQTSTHCVTPEELKAVNGTPAEFRAFIEGTTTAAHCKVENLKMEGNTVSYTTTCAKVLMDSTTTYHGDHFEMVMNTKGGGDSPTRQVKARWLGACP